MALDGGYADEGTFAIEQAPTGAVEPVALAGDEVSAVGAEARFQQFFAAELPRLVGYCTGLLRDREVAADIAQEALVRTYARWVTVREPHAYAYLVATNLVRRAWRKEASRREAIAEMERARSSSSDSAPDAGIRDVVERLPDRLRVPVLLHYYADLPIEEVARLLLRPAGTIRRQLHDARARLAVELTEDVS